MKAGTYNIYCDQGTTFSLTFRITNPDDTPMDLTGYTARMHVRRDYDSANTVVELTTENGRISIDEANGAITLSMDATTTAAITNSGVYDIELVSSTGTVERPVRGQFILEKEVTR